MSGVYEYDDYEDFYGETMDDMEHTTPEYDDGDGEWDMHTPGDAGDDLPYSVEPDDWIMDDGDF